MHMHDAAQRSQSLCFVMETQHVGFEWWTAADTLNS